MTGDHIAQLARIEADATDFALIRRARNGAFTAQSKSSSYRLWPMRLWLENGACSHDTP
jgi:hypothetical protein